MAGVLAGFSVSSSTLRNRRRTWIKMSTRRNGSEEDLIHGGPVPDIPDHHSVGQYLFDRLTAGGDKVAQIDGRSAVQATYRQVLQRAVNAAMALENLGVHRGDMVLICSENCFDFTVAILAVFFTGATATLANVTYTHDELKHAMALAQPMLVMSSSAASAGLLRAAAELRSVKTVLSLDGPAPGCVDFASLTRFNLDVTRFQPREVVGHKDAAVMLFSSGTTGLSKGVLHSHMSLLYSLQEGRQNMRSGLTDGEQQTALMVAPWFHMFGLITFLELLACNDRGVFFARFDDASYLKAIEQYKVNITFMVPPLMLLLTKSDLADRYDYSSLKQIWSGAAPLSKELEQVTCKLFGVPFVKNGYASTETGLVTQSHYEFRHGSVGQLALGISAKVVNPDTGAAVGVGEPGELLVHSRKCMLGYRGDAAATRAAFTAEGFVRTGDILYYDEDMYFYVVDRLKELIKYKGFQVPPAELEGVLQSHPAVMECGVVGIPDELAGELPLAFVVLRPGAHATEAELQEFVATKVSSPKRLRGGVRFVVRIPQNPSGKVLRRELRALLKTKSKL